VTKDKKLQFNVIWDKGGKSMEALIQKVTVRGLEPTEKNCFEYYMGWIRPFVVTKWGKVEWKNPYWDRNFRNVRRRKKQPKRYNKNKNRKSRR
jgi:hypothetical protein